MRYGQDKIGSVRQVQGHYTKVKVQIWIFCISINLQVQKQFKTTHNKAIQRTLQMTLTHFSKLSLRFQGHRSKVRSDLPMHTYVIWQDCMPSIKLVPLTVAEKSSGQKFHSIGHCAKVKGQIHKSPPSGTATPHGDDAYQVWRSCYV